MDIESIFAFDRCIKCASHVFVIIEPSFSMERDACCRMCPPSSHTKCNHSMHVNLMKQYHYILYCTYHSWCTWYQVLMIHKLISEEISWSDNWKPSFFLWWVRVGQRPAVWRAAIGKGEANLLKSLLPVGTPLWRDNEREMKFSHLAIAVG